MGGLLGARQIRAGLGEGGWRSACFGSHSAARTAPGCPWPTPLPLPLACRPPCLPQRHQEAVEHGLPARLAAVNAQIASYRQQLRGLEQRVDERQRALQASAPCLPSCLPLARLHPAGCPACSAVARAC